MVAIEQCAWITEDGYCRWHKDRCCRTSPGACQACVHRAHSRKGNYCWIMKEYDMRTAKGRMQFHTRDAKGWRVFSQCKAKTRYADEFRAKEVARLRMRNGSEPLRVYYCVFCDGYHLTHKMKHDEESAVA